MRTTDALVDAIDSLLPQTQCTKCGYNGCRPYAEAIAHGQAEINRCPPGGMAGIAALAAALQRPRLPLDLTRGQEGPRRLAYIDESRCIGCTLCIQACPVDAIIGAPKQMHAIIEDLCTGCDLCVAPCPVDCIEMIPLLSPAPWTHADAEAARSRYQARQLRLRREQEENAARLAAKATRKLAALEHEIAQSASDPALERKRAVVQAAIERARQRQQSRQSQDS